MAPILDGLRVVDLSWGSAGPITTMLLSDHGAEVVKIEPPGGDPFRGTPGYTVWNRGKKSVVLDLHDDADRARFVALAADADVVVESFAPGVTTRLGVDYETIRERNDRVVYCSITGYGRTGASAARPGYDALVQARSGLQYEQPGRRDGPIFLHLALPSFGAAFLAAVGISAALRAREITGSGQWVETSLMQGSLLWTTQIWKRAERPTAPLFDLWAYKDLPPTPCFEAANGEWFHPMLQGLPVALAHVGRDPGELDLRAMISGDRESREAVFAAVREVMRQRPREEWLQVFRGADVPCQLVMPVETAFDHPQVVHNGAIATIDVPGAGPVTQLGHTYRLERHTDAVPGPPPAVDQHRQEVLERPATPVARPDPAPRGTLSAALDGVRVLDFGTAVAGPFGGMILADLGADVIKIDPLSPSVGTAGDAVWVSGARGKRSIAINLKSSEGNEIVRRLIASADVIHYNLRPGVAERLGYGYEDAAAINPRIVFSHLTAYGSTGPLSSEPGTDQMAQALCGLEYEQGAGPAGGEPTWYRFGMTDAASGMLSVLGILQALMHRERTGLGQAVDTNILNAGMLFASDAVIGPVTLPRRPVLDYDQTGFGAYYRLYETADGWVCIAAVTDAQRERLHAVVGHDLATSFRTRLASEWRDLLDDAGVPCEVAAARTDDWYDDPDAVANGWVVAYEHPVWGRLEQPGTFVHLSATPGRIAGPPPLIGEHTDEILREVGYTDEEIAALHANRVVGGPADDGSP